MTIKIVTDSTADLPAKLVKELQDFVKERLALNKYPRFVEFVDALPRTERGKVNRAAGQGPVRLLNA